MILHPTPLSNDVIYQDGRGGSNSDSLISSRLLHRYLSGGVHFVEERKQEV